MKNGIYIEDGDRYWYKDGELHRVDGPAIEYANGDKSWYVFGIPHRLDGPAFISEQSVSWWVDGVLHREDGPAVIFTFGERPSRQEWWISGVQLTESDFKNWKQKKALNKKLQSALTPNTTTKRGKI